ncbi:type I restriction enzyme, S subunit [Streptococcus equinus]|nr:type I restriction enzyme, S subunit [Streptococcus equinus]
MKTNGVPKIRFKGFTDDWEERKLSSGLHEYTDRVIVEDDKEYYQISVRNNFGGITLRGSKMGNKIGRKRQAKINLTKYPQTLIFTRQTVEQGGIGWVEKYCDGAIVTENMPTISLDTSVFSKYFLTNLFQTKIFYKNAILDNIEGGSAQIAIHESKFLSSTLLFPNLDEQEKIGSFFKQIDETITLHQRKCEQTKELKKFMLQKMFPKKGEKNPEIRFPGFTDDWEQRKLEDIVEFLDTMRRPLEGAKRIPGPYPYYGASGIVDYVEDYIFDEELVLLSEDGANITDRNYPVCFLAAGKYWVNNHAHVLKAKLGNENNFICNSLERKDYKQYNTGMAMPKLNQDVCRKIPVSCPSYEEQKKIGNYFRDLDRLITLHQRKCEQLKELKKFMLQNMFPKKG